jgi:hypothetical protein
MLIAFLQFNQLRISLRKGKFDYWAFIVMFVRCLPLNKFSKPLAPTLMNQIQNYSPCPKGLG